MSWQAMEAVQDNSKIENHIALCIMYALARFADADGVVGANGRITSPSADTIAEKARISRRTFFNWLPKLEESGELIVDRNGAGRGAWNKYTINLPISESIGASYVAPIKENIGVNNGELTVQDLAVMVQDLALLVKGTVHNGASYVAPDTKDTKENIYIHPDLEPVAEIKTALSQVTKTPFWEETKESYDDAAAVLIGWDATPETISGFGEWWEKNGHYPGKPALKSLLGEYRNYLSGIAMPKNGHTNTIKQANDAAGGVYV